MILRSVFQCAGFCVSLSACANSWDGAGPDTQTNTGTGHENPLTDQADGNGDPTRQNLCAEYNSLARNSTEYRGQVKDIETFKGLSGGKYAPYIKPNMRSVEISLAGYSLDEVPGQPYHMFIEIIDKQETAGKGWRYYHIHGWAWDPKDEVFEPEIGGYDDDLKALVGAMQGNAPDWKTEPEKTYFKTLYTGPACEAYEKIFKGLDFIQRLNNADIEYQPVTFTPLPFNMFRASNSNAVANTLLIEMGLDKPTDAQNLNAPGFNKMLRVEERACPPLTYLAPVQYILDVYKDNAPINTFPQSADNWTDEHFRWAHGIYYYYAGHKLSTAGSRFESFNKDTLGNALKTRRDICVESIPVPKAQ